eukprot:TRINITY_DN10236_c0_g1_i1.p1 TRINITY_DN10236_c0_g1~~TRINITY_DN10236_c0_g1_i1.p1  ORF type:complete len:394 (+),score=56.28 TRINITY_DN10236_c0_g1_i1:39-1220(+)
MDLFNKIFRGRPPVTPEFGAKQVELFQSLAHRPPAEALVNSGILKDTAIPLRLEIIEKLCDYIQEKGIGIEGLFRESGNALDIHKLYLTFRGDINLSNTNNIHTVTGTLKRYLKEQSEPLIPYQVYPELTEAIAIEDQSKKLSVIKSVLQEIPPERYAILKRIMQLLSNIRKNSKANLMTSGNLGITIGQVIAWPKDVTDHFTCVPINSAIATAMIENYDYLFEDAELSLSNTVIPSPPETSREPVPQSLKLTVPTPTEEARNRSLSVSSSPARPKSMVVARPGTFKLPPTRSQDEIQKPKGRPPAYPPPPRPMQKSSSFPKLEPVSYEDVLSGLVNEDLSQEERLKFASKFSNLVSQDDQFKNHLKTVGVDQLINVFSTFCRTLTNEDFCKT